MQNMQTIRAFVDQINEGLVTLLLGEDESVRITIPVEWLPAGVREGQVLKLAFHIDLESTDKAKKQTKDLFDKLGNNP
jgi:hypothetical protein